MFALGALCITHTIAHLWKIASTEKDAVDRECEKERKSTAAREQRRKMRTTRSSMRALSNASSDDAEKAVDSAVNNNNGAVDNVNVEMN